MSWPERARQLLLAPIVLSEKMLKIRIRMLPHDKRDVEGYDLRAYEPNHIYEVNSKLAELLIVLGYAEPEMRRQPDRCDDRPRRRRSDQNGQR